MAVATPWGRWRPFASLVLAEPLRLPLRRVLVPIDLSETARGALMVALTWASALRSRDFARLTVYRDVGTSYFPNPHPAFPAVWCYVKNSGLKQSDWFKTLIRIYRYGTPYTVDAASTVGRLSASSERNHSPSRPVLSRA